MDNFNFHIDTRILFGKGMIKELVPQLKAAGATRVLVHFGSERIRKSGLLTRIERELEDAKLPYYELGGVVANPRLKLVKEGIALAKREKVDFILAIGGGSVIDSAKAIGVGFYCDDFWDYHFMQGNPTKKMLGVGVVLTLAATGSESSTSCVISDDQSGYKRGIGGEALQPKFAICDPENTFSVPADQTANGSCDIFCHLLERYFTPSKDVEISDNMIEAVMKTVVEYAAKAIENPHDYNARAQLMWASTLAHDNLLNMGRLGDWASHKIEHELSAKYAIAHGAGLAIVFPAWMKYVLNKDMPRFARLGRNVFGITELDDGKAAVMAIEAFENWCRNLGLKTRLSELNISGGDFAEMAERCLTLRPYVGEFVRLNSEDVQKIYRLAL